MSTLISGSRRLIQRAKADGVIAVEGGTTTHVTGVSVGKGGRGGVDHSEQLLWTNQLQAKVENDLEKGRKLAVTFEVDTTVCSGCVPWFEDVLYPHLQRRARAGRGEAKLYVRVGGVTVEIVGASTIWPPEVTDAPTFDRMEEPERSMRFLRENRDESGHIRAEKPSNYVKSGIDELERLLSTYEYFGLTVDAIGDALDKAKAQIATDDLMRAMFESETDEDKKSDLDADPYREWIDDKFPTVTLSLIMNSGGFTLPEMPEHDRDNPDLPGDVAKWLALLMKQFESWLWTWIETHQDFPQRVKTEY